MKQYPLNILYLHNRSLISGGERSLLNLWINLDKARFIPFLIIPEPGDLSDAAAEIGIIADYYPIPDIRAFNSVSIIKSIRFLTEYIKKNNIAMIHSYSPRNNLIGAMAAKISRIPIIWHERNMLYGNEFDLSRLFMSLPDKIICNSNAVAERFRQNGKLHSKIITIHNGVNTALFIPAKNGKHEHKKTITIGAITNLDKQKGAHLIPDIAAKVLSHINEVEFIVIGAGLNEDTESRLNELRHIVAEKNITKHITFKGYSNHVNNDLQSFDIFIHVTRNEYKEACSRAILEAQASGLPVIAFNNGGNPELIVDQVTGILVPEGDMTKFAEALLHLIRHPEIRQSMGQQARQRVEKYFNVRFNAARTQSLYEELAQNALGD